MVSKPNIEKQVQEIAAPLAAALQVDVVDISCQGGKSGGVLRVIIDKPGGVGIQDCEQFHRSFLKALEVAESEVKDYRLEVSSPGADRPLKSVDDYRRQVGQLIRVKLTAPIGGQWLLVGRLIEVHDQGIVLNVEESKQEKRLDVGWEHIHSARCEVEF